ncbi:hypothetical protein TNCV_1268501 [Trichonephila clavipes]|nr:hypothetical protein TNCV_1268501 [Trichonephila clavipes]
MMWFVREEFLWGQLSTKVFRPSPVLSLSLPYLASGMTETDVFSFHLHPASGRKGVSCRVKGFWGDPRQDRAITLKLQVPIHVWRSTKTIQHR